MIFRRFCVEPVKAFYFVNGVIQTLPWPALPNTLLTANSEKLGVKIHYNRVKYINIVSKITIGGKIWSKNVVRFDTRLLPATTSVRKQFWYEPQELHPSITQIGG